MGRAGVDFLRTADLLDGLRRAAEGAGGVDDIVEQDAGLALDVADDVHNLGLIRLLAAFVNYEEKYLLSELKSTRNALAAAYSNFDYALDPYLIDSSIYELNSVQKRYMFLLERAKESNVEIPAEML